MAGTYYFLVFKLYFLMAFYLQVRWQATQFLLRRLTRELTILNSAFARLSVMLPPTRWENKRRKAERRASLDRGRSSLDEPLLRNHSR